MLHITFAFTLALSLFANAESRLGHAVIRAKAEPLTGYALESWLDRNADRLDAALELQPRELVAALRSFGASDDFTAELTLGLDHRSTVVAQKKFLIGVLRRAWGQPPEARDLAQANRQAVFRYLLATHGVPHRSFATAEAARDFVAAVTSNAADRPLVERSVVSWQGRHYFLFTYDVWPKISAVERQMMIVPDWDPSTRVGHELQLTIAPSDDLAAIAARYSGGVAPAFERELRRRLFVNEGRPIVISVTELLNDLPALNVAARTHGRTIVAAGETLRPGDVLVYSGAGGERLRSTVYAADGFVLTNVDAASGEAAGLVSREQDELHAFDGRHFRLTVYRATDGTAQASTTPVYFEDWLTPAPTPHVFTRCVRALLGR